MDLMELNDSLMELVLNIAMILQNVVVARVVTKLGFRGSRVSNNVTTGSGTTGVAATALCPCVSSL